MTHGKRPEAATLGLFLSAQAVGCIIGPPIAATFDSAAPKKDPPAGGVAPSQAPLKPASGPRLNESDIVASERPLARGAVIGISLHAISFIMYGLGFKSDAEWLAFFSAMMATLLRNIGATIVSLAGNVMLQRHVEKHVLGSVFAVASALSAIAEATGVLMGGVLFSAARIGTPTAAWLASIMAGACAVIWYVRVGALYRGWFRGACFGFASLDSTGTQNRTTGLGEFACTKPPFVSHPD